MPLDVPLEALILTVLRELPSGDVVRVTIADPKLASIGTRSGTQAELATFLGEHLTQIPPSALARYVSPPGAELVSVEVVIEREDLPRRLQIQVPTLFRAVVVPAGRARWVFVPVLGHVAYVGPGEDMESTLKAEIARLVSASESTAETWLSLLPALVESLEVLPVAIDRRERAPGGRAAALHQQLVAAARTREALEVLDSVGMPIDPRKAEAGRWVGREAELATLTALLGAKSKQSVLVVGRERVGKSALISAWLASERRAGRTRLAYVTSGAQLVAGMSGLGQWQERLKRTLQAAETLDAVLVFDDIGDLFGDTSGGGLDLSGAMRPWLQEGRARVVAEVTPEALNLFEPRDVGFFGCFARVRVEPLDAARTRQALELRTALGPGVPPSPAALDTVMELADRYLPYRPLPGKVIGLYEEVAARADELRDPSGNPRRMEPEDVLEAFSQSSGIPVFLLREDRALYRDQVTAVFRRRLIGQDDAIRRVIDTICVVKAGLQPTGKPLATFLFVGPTGVGKTELARTLAEFLFGAADRLVRFDMSEYADALAAERLFHGGQGAEGLLTRQIRQQPFAVLLLDEIEKAHGSVFDLLLQVTGEGRLTDARGRTAYFHNSIVIMTSNLGAAHRRSELGIARDATSDESYYFREVERAFRPELVNRLDRVITFEPLSAEQVEEVGRIAVRKLGARRGFSAGRIMLDASESAVSLLSRRGYSPSYGARALRRELEDRLVAPAARLLASVPPEAGRGGRLVVSTADEQFVRLSGPSSEQEGLRFQLVSGPVRGTRVDARQAATAISALRVEATRALSLERVVHVRESIDTLVASLARATKANDPRRGADLAMLQRDHHRLSELWRAADGPYQDLLAAEELALSAYISHQEPGDAGAVAAAAIDAFRRALALVLLAEEPSPNHAMVRVRELDDARPLEAWLSAFAGGAEARGWSVRVHVSAHSGPDWPRARYFGPPRSMADVLRLYSAGSGSTELLLAVEGPWASALLSLEAGLHRISGWGGRIDPTHLLVRVQAGRTEFNDEEWLTLFAYESPDTKTDYTKRPAVRELDARRDTLRFEGGSLPSRRDLSTYWRDLELVAYQTLTRSVREGDAS